MAHLITATNSKGVIRSNAYDYAIHVVVDYVMDFMIKPAPGEKEAFIVKMGKLLSHKIEKKHGAGYRYCVLGASNTYLPYKEITTYLTSKIFEGFSGLKDQMPSDGDIDLFVQTIGLKYEDISKTLNQNVPSVPLYAVDTATLYEQTEGMSADNIPQVLNQMNDSLSKISGQIAENKKAMLEELGETTIESGKNIASLITRVRGELLKIASQSDKGPYYAGAILHNVNDKDLKNRIDGYIAGNDNNLRHAMADMTFRKQSVADTLRLLQNSNRLNRGKRGRDYVQAVNSYCKQDAKIYFLSVMNDVLVEFKKQANDLYANYYAIYEKVMRKLEATFKANLTTLAEPVVADNGYAVKLMTIQDLKESLDNSVEAMQIDDLISRFVNHMLNHFECWIAQDENKIAHGVSEFFLNELEEFTSKTIIDYLKIKFKADNSQRIKEKVYEEIIKPLSDNAAPLFWVDQNKHKISNSSEIGFCTIPQISDEIKGAFEKYHADDNDKIEPRPSYNTDRINFLILRCGIPMYAYKGVDEYRRVKRVIGAHLYEGAVGDDRDWRNLPDIVPYSLMNANDCSEELKSRADSVDKAVELKILEHRETGTDGSFYFIIKELDGDKIDEMIKTIKSAIKEGNIEKAKAVHSAILVEDIPVKYERSVKNIGAQGHEDVVVKDLIIASEQLSGIIENSLVIAEKRETALSDLEKFIENGK